MIGTNSGRRSERGKLLRTGCFRQTCGAHALCVILLVSVAAAQSPPSQTELNGFLLGQYKKVLDNTFGTPYKEIKTEDGWLYLAYLLDKQSEAYMWFKFTNDDQKHVFSIQIEGLPTTKMTPFLGLRLGDDKSRVMAVLGQPSAIRPDNELKLELYKYDGRNYSVEINAQGKLSSIQIFGYEGFLQEPKSFPRIEKLQQYVLQRDIDGLMTVLAPDFEAYKGGQTYTFSTAARSELSHASSPLVRFLLGDRDSLRAVFAVERLNGEPEIRIYTKAAPGRVFKFPRSKIIREIVYKFFAGDWKVWEVQFR